MVFYQCSLLCGCVGATNRSQKRVRSRLRAGIFRACVGILSAISFFYFFVLVTIEIRDNAEFRERINTIRAVVALTEVIAQERGRTALYISGGFDDSLRADILKTRTSVNDLRTELDRVSGKGRDFPTLNTALEEHNKIEQLRADIDASIGLSPTDPNRVSEQTAFAAFSKYNELFANFNLRQSFTNQEGISRVLYSVVREGIYLEASGIVRGLLGSVFARGFYLDNDEVLAVRASENAQQSAYRELLVLLDDEDREVEMSSLVRTPEVNEALSFISLFRNISFVDPLQYNASNPFPVEATAWFGNVTIFLDSFQVLRTHLFERLLVEQDKQLVITITEFVIALVALVLEITACTTLILIAWPVLKLFWTMEGKARKISDSSTRGTTSKAGTGADTDDGLKNDINKHNSFVLEMSDVESATTELSSSKDKSSENEEPVEPRMSQTQTPRAPDVMETPKSRRKKKSARRKKKSPE